MANRVQRAKILDNESVPWQSPTPWLASFSPLYDNSSVPCFLSDDTSDTSLKVSPFGIRKGKSKGALPLFLFLFLLLASYNPCGNSKEHCNWYKAHPDTKPKVHGSFSFFLTPPFPPPIHSFLPSFKYLLCPFLLCLVSFLQIIWIRDNILSNLPFSMIIDPLFSTFYESHEKTKYYKKIILY